LFKREAEEQVGDEGGGDEQASRADQGAENVDHDMVGCAFLSFLQLAVTQARELSRGEAEGGRDDYADEVGRQQRDGGPHPLLRRPVEVHGPGLELAELLREFHA